MDPCVFKQLYWITPLNCALIVRINTYTVKSYLFQRRFVLCLLVFLRIRGCSSGCAEKLGSGVDDLENLPGISLTDATRFVKSHCRNKQL